MNDPRTMSEANARRAAAFLPSINHGMTRSTSSIWPSKGAGLDAPVASVPPISWPWPSAPTPTPSTMRRCLEWAHGRPV